MIDRFYSTGQLLALRASRQRWERRERQALSAPKVESVSAREDFVERLANAPVISELCSLLDRVEMRIALDEIEEALAAEALSADTVDHVTQRLGDSPAARALREVLDPTQVDQLLFDAVKSRAQGISDHECFNALRRALLA